VTRKFTIVEITELLAGAYHNLNEVPSSFIATKPQLMKYCFTLFFSLLFFFSLKAQLPDSVKLKFQINAELYGAQHFYNVYARTKMPRAINEVRKLRMNLPVSFDTITDNPFKHGVMYAAVKTKTRIFGKVEVNADLYGEYRGFSYGSFNNNNTVVYPVISVALKDSFLTGNDYLKIFAETGQFLNEKVDEGLMIYNTDLQWTKGAIRYKNSQLSFTICGDLYNGIGYGIDDLKSFTYTHFFNNDQLTAGFSYAMANPPYTQAKYHTYLNLFGRIRMRNMAFYGQLSFTPGYGDIDILKGVNRRTAGLLGIEQQLQNKRFRVQHKAELRYYGYAYNNYHIDWDLRYRKHPFNADEMYSNTTGKYLYPLRKYNTPFSQWGVFSEYLGYNVLGGSMVGLVSYRWSEKISLELDYDINAIFARVDKAFTFAEPVASYFVYPFFKTAVKYYPFDKAYLSFFLTNKAMNLDIGYPSHYLMQKPFAGMEFYISI
jgi:hypothetical protein